ncbi:hypothetical protein Tco_0220780 [Tanacetum coccineum]
MILLVVILPVGCFVPSCWSLSFLLDALFLLVAMDYADGSVFMLVDSFLLIGSVFLLSAWFLLLVASFCWLHTFMLLDFCCAQFDIAGWLVSVTSHLVSAGGLQSCWCNNVSAE